MFRAGDRKQRIRSGQIHDGAKQRRHRIAENRSASGLRRPIAEQRFPIQNPSQRQGNRDSEIYRAR